MGGTIPVATAELVGTFLEGVYYGIYLVVFPQTMIVLYKRKFSTISKMYFMGTMIVSMFLITAHLVVDLVRAFQAFTAHLSIGDSPERYYATVNTPWNIAKNSTYCTVTLVADLLILYRTFVVWNRNLWVVLFPVLLFGLDFGMSVWFTWSVHEAIPGNSVLVSSVFERSRYFFVATLAINLVCTLLIAYKLWNVGRGLRGFSTRASRGPSALALVLESAAIYTVALVCLIGTSVTFDSAMFFFLNSMPPVIGSVFSYIILRSAESKRHIQTSTTLGTANLTSFAAVFRSRGARVDETMHTHPHFDSESGVHVHLERVTVNDNGSVRQVKEGDSDKVSDTKKDDAVYAV